MRTRTLYLVRHGQYLPADDNKQLEVLTKLGRKQANLVGKRLSEVTFSAFHHSTMPRAIETAEIIAAHLPELKRSQSPLLREGLPSIARHFPASFRRPSADLKQTRQRMDRAFARYARPSRSDRNELVVAHGNIIRYFIRRALGDSVARWWQMDIIQGSLSVIRITPRHCVVVSYNDVGHLPPAFRTYV